MGTRTSYGPGTFCWINLSSTDVEAAKRFYAALFGWDYAERPADGATFSMARRYGADVAAIYGQEEQERAHGLPSHWNSHVSVEDADASADRAKELGGAVLVEPFDVSDAGRTAVLADPAGATFRVWQPRRHIGAGRVNDVGCLTWNDLITNDAERASAFYSGLFGWRFKRLDTGDGPAYWVIQHQAAAGGINGGMRELSGDEAQTIAPAWRWVPYFTVESAASTIDEAKAFGGRVLDGPVRIGAGTVAVMRDPTGAVFAVFEGPIDD
ncbi:MAG TPA: VOC family protein [Woeseiaceae bacterium]